jgi:hypothetical protein
MMESERSSVDAAAWRPSGSGGHEEDSLAITERDLIR